MNQPEITTQSFLFVLMSVVLTKRSKWLIKQNLRKHVVPLSNNLNTLLYCYLCDIPYTHLCDSRELLLVLLYCSQVPIQRVAGFVKRLTTVSLQSQANGTLATLILHQVISSGKMTNNWRVVFILDVVYGLHSQTLSLNYLYFRMSTWLPVFSSLHICST